MITAHTITYYYYSIRFWCFIFGQPPCSTNFVGWRVLNHSHHDHTNRESHDFSSFQSSSGFPPGSMIMLLFALRMLWSPWVWTHHASSRSFKRTLDGPNPGFAEVSFPQQSLPPPAESLRWRLPHQPVKSLHTDSVTGGSQQNCLQFVLYAGDAKDLQRPRACYAAWGYPRIPRFLPIL